MKNNIQRPGLIVRSLVIIYDILLLGGVVFACHALIFAALLIFPEAIRGSIIIKGVHFFMLLFIVYYFYGWFWVNGGQTLGMKAWHLYLIDKDGKFLNWKGATIRFFSTIVSIACLGMGFAWILVNKKKLAWHDILSKSQIIKVKPKKS